METEPPTQNEVAMNVVSRMASRSFTGGMARRFVRDVEQDLTQSETLLQQIEGRLQTARKELIDMYESLHLEMQDKETLFSNSDVAPVMANVAKTFAKAMSDIGTEIDAKVKSAMEIGKKNPEVASEKETDMHRPRKVILGQATGTYVAEEHKKVYNAISVVLESLANNILSDIRLQNPFKHKDIWNQDLQNELDRHREFSHSLKEQLHNLMERLKRHDTKMEILRGHLIRRNKLIEDQRTLYYKELVILREQLYQKQSRGDEYYADEWGHIFDHDLLEREALGLDGDTENVGSKSPLARANIAETSQKSGSVARFEDVEQSASSPKESIENSKLKQELEFLRQRLRDRDSDSKKIMQIQAQKLARSENEIIADLMKKLTDQQNDFSISSIAMQKQIEAKEKMKWEKTIEDQLQAQKDEFAIEISNISEDFRLEIKELQKESSANEFRATNAEKKLKELTVIAEERLAMVTKLSDDIRDQRHRFEEIMLRKIKEDSEGKPSDGESVNLVQELKTQKDQEILELKKLASNQEDELDRLKTELERFSEREGSSMSSFSGLPRFRKGVDSQVVDKIKSQLETSYMAYEELQTRYIELNTKKEEVEQILEDTNDEKNKLHAWKFEVEGKIVKIEELVLGGQYHNLEKIEGSSSSLLSRRKSRVSLIASPGGKIANSSTVRLASRSRSQSIAQTPTSEGVFSQRLDEILGVLQMENANAAAHQQEETKSRSSSISGQHSKNILNKRGSSGGSVPSRRSSVMQTFTNRRESNSNSHDKPVSIAEEGAQHIDRSLYPHSELGHSVQPHDTSGGVSDKENAAHENRETHPGKHRYSLQSSDAANKGFVPSLSIDKLIEEPSFVPRDDEPMDENIANEKDGTGNANIHRQGDIATDYASRSSLLRPYDGKSGDLPASASSMSIATSARENDRQGWSQERFFLYKRIENLENELMAARGQINHLHRTFSTKRQTMSSLKKKEASTNEVKKFQEALQRDIELQERETLAKWKLLYTGLTSSQKIKSVTEAPSYQKRMNDELNKMSVFERVHIRGIFQSDRLREKMKFIKEERQANMERVLSSILLLVRPTYPSSDYAPLPKSVNSSIVNLKFGNRDSKSLPSRPKSSKTDFEKKRSTTPEEMRQYHDFLEHYESLNHDLIGADSTIVDTSRTSKTAKIEVVSETGRSDEKLIDESARHEPALKTPPRPNSSRAQTPRPPTSRPSTARGSPSPASGFPRRVVKEVQNDDQYKDFIDKRNSFVSPSTSALKLGGGFSTDGYTPRKTATPRPNSAPNRFTKSEPIEYTIKGHRISQSSSDKTEQKEASIVSESKRPIRPSTAKPATKPEATPRTITQLQQGPAPPSSPSASQEPFNELLP